MQKAKHPLHLNIYTTGQFVAENVLVMKMECKIQTQLQLNK
jgi:hypothetical protein